MGTDDRQSGVGQPDAMYYANYAMAAYGWMAMKFLGLVEVTDPSYDDKQVVERLTGVSQDKIVYGRWEGGLYQPGTYVTIDEKKKAVVVALRGTMRVQDALTDLVCEAVPWKSNVNSDNNDAKDEEGGGDDGGSEDFEHKVHSGFMKAAHQLDDELRGHTLKALKEHPEFKLVICGHSLGAGAASTLGLMWRQHKAFRDVNMKVFAYAPPCVFSKSLAEASEVRLLIESYVLGDDLVPRLSHASMEDLRNALVMILDKDDKSKDAELIRRNVMKGDKLYPAGKILYMEDKPEGEGEAEIKMQEQDDFGEIVISNRMLMTHLPNEYFRAIDRLVV